MTFRSDCWTGPTGGTGYRASRRLYSDCRCKSSSRDLNIKAGQFQLSFNRSLRGISKAHSHLELAEDRHSSASMAASFALAPIGLWLDNICLLGTSFSPKNTN